MFIRRKTAVTFAGAALLALMALWPYVPHFDRLAKEGAKVVRFTATGPLVKHVVFRTSSGAEVSCARSRSGGCPIEQLAELKTLQRELVVWHDGERVFQIADRGTVFFPYDSERGARAFALLLAALAALCGLIKLGFDTGLINRYDSQGKPQ